MSGMIVAGFARRVEKIKEIADCLKDSSDKLHAVKCDVTKEESITIAFAWVKDNLGPISVLVNSAGITKESSLIGKDFNIGQKNLKKTYENFFRSKEILTKFEFRIYAKFLLWICKSFA